MSTKPNINGIEVKVGYVSKQERHHIQGKVLWINEHQICLSEGVIPFATPSIAIYSIVKDLNNELIFENDQVLQDYMKNKHYLKREWR